VAREGVQFLTAACVDGCVCARVQGEPVAALHIVTTAHGVRVQRRAVCCEHRGDGVGQRGPILPRHAPPCIYACELGRATSQPPPPLPRVDACVQILAIEYGSVALFCVLATMACAVLAIVGACRAPGSAHMTGWRWRAMAMAQARMSCNSTSRRSQR
jgi:hypothetical protein